jgi:hypothetical protein
MKDLIRLLWACFAIGAMAIAAKTDWKQLAADLVEDDEEGQGKAKEETRH